MDNWEEDNLEQIGAKIPREVAQAFKASCKLKTTGRRSINQRQLFYNIAKWWLGLDESIQSLIFQGEIQQAHREIAASVQADAFVSESEDDAAALKRKGRRRQSSKSG